MPFPYHLRVLFPDPRFFPSPFVSIGAFRQSPNSPQRSKPSLRGLPSESRRLPCRSLRPADGAQKGKAGITSTARKRRWVRTRSLGVCLSVPLGLWYSQKKFQERGGGGPPTGMVLSTPPPGLGGGPKKKPDTRPPTSKRFGLYSPPLI